MSLDLIKNAISQLENERIESKNFFMNLEETPQPYFVTNVDIQRKTGLPESEVVNVLRRLDRQHFIVFDNLFGFINDPAITVIVRSRIFHIIWCLINSQNITGGSVNGVREPNVGDFKYVQKIKKIPERIHELREIYQTDEIKKILGGDEDRSETGETTVTPPYPILQEIIEYISTNYHIPRISEFQKQCTINTIKELFERTVPNAVPKGLVFVAGTGFGKTFAYQFPVIIWILLKKIEKYDEFIINTTQGDGIVPPVNCTLLLVLPRTSLAKDQLREFVDLIDKVNEWIDANINDDTQKESLKIKAPLGDFTGGTGKAEQKWTKNPDIIICHPTALQNRLVNPDCHSVFSKNIDLILYDEVHTWEGIGGAEVAALNARLQNVFNKPPLFVGMSATIDNPDIHCQKLFALVTNDKPKIIEQGDEPEIPFTIEHHLMLKPAAGRSLPGVGLETTSCLIHNRRNGLNRLHDDLNNGAGVNTRTKEKTITFYNSLEKSQQYVDDLNDYEEYFGQGQFGGSTGLAKPLQPHEKPHRQYFYYARPRQGQSYDSGTGRYSESCDDCKNRNTPDLLNCEFYSQGNCWYYSEDDSNQFNNIRWVPSVTPTTSRPPTWMPVDNVRSKRASSEDFQPNVIEDYFKDRRRIRDQTADPTTGERERHSTPLIQIDNVVSTPSLEVGVDFDNVTEIIQIGPVTSASSYKQKAGRGARQGDMVRGLFAMSVIDETPVSYFHFKHFDRLINSALDPLKLQITNLSVVNTHSFRTIFDFLARKGIKLYRIYENGTYTSTSDLNTQYTSAIALLDSSEVKVYVKQFLKKMGFTTKSESDVINYAKNFLQALNRKYRVPDSTSQNGNFVERSLHEICVMCAVNQNHWNVMSPILSTFNQNHQRQQIIESLDRFNDECEVLRTQTNFSNLQNAIENLRSQIQNE